MEWLSKARSAFRGLVDSAGSARDKLAASFWNDTADMHAGPVVKMDDLSAINSILGGDELLKIFDLLTPKELLTTAALVCSRWWGSFNAN